MPQRFSALRLSRNESRLAVAAASARRGGSGLRFAPIEMVQMDQSTPPEQDWVELRPRLSGICGSDLATLDGSASDYFDPWVSFPFVPGHEVVADGPDGRVVLEPELGHTCRGTKPPSRPDYASVVAGSLSAGIQTGFCADVPGAWSERMWAHPSQLHSVPDQLDDAAAVMVEPTACAIRAVLRGRIADGASVAVIGAGTMGLAALAAVRHFTEAGTLVAVAKYPDQARMARRLGADVVVGPDGLNRAVRRVVGGHTVGPDLSSGADGVIDAVGSATSIRSAIGVCRPRGRVVLLGMPGRIDLDLTPVWHRETELVGSYTYGPEELVTGRRAHTFELAFELVEAAGLGDLVSARYRLDRYLDALDHAVAAGVRGAHKIVFCPA